MLSLVPTAELPWFRVTWDRRHQSHVAGAFDEHAPLVEELLARVRDGGPLSSPGTWQPRPAIDWYWRPTNQVRALLEALSESGVLAIARREGNRRVYDLAERLFPAELLARRVPEPEQRRHKLLTRYRGVGLLGATAEYAVLAGTGDPAQRAAMRAELVAQGVIVPVDVEGFKGPRFVMGEEVALLDAAEAEVAAGGPMDGAGVGRSSRPWTRSRGTGTCCSGSGASTSPRRPTCSRPRRSARTSRRRFRR